MRERGGDGQEKRRLSGEDEKKEIKAQLKTTDFAPRGNPKIP